MFKSKKAISPLVATILLLAFAVALGSVVMSWGKGLIEKASQDKQEITVEECKIAKECFEKNAITIDESNILNQLVCPS